MTPSNPKNSRRWIATLLFFFGGLFLLLTLQEGCYQKALKLRGVVIAKEYSPGTSRVGSGTMSSSSRHKIRYRYTTPEGKIKEDRSDVLLQNWSKARVGDSINIEYLPATGDSRVAGQTASAPVFLAIALALLTAGFAARRSEDRV